MPDEDLRDPADDTVEGAVDDAVDDAVENDAVESDAVESDDLHGDDLDGAEPGDEPPAAEEPDDDGDDEPDDALLVLAADVGEPDQEAADTVRSRLGGDDVTRYGRLGELARWWASVRADVDAPPPRTVLLAGGGTDVAARRPGTRALALPRGIDVEAALTWGVEAAGRAADDGTELICLTLDDHAPWRALAADLMALDAVEASGWPADRGMSDEIWMDGVTELRDQLRRLRGLRSRPTALLAALGSPVVAAAAGLLVAATAHRLPVVLDGPGAAAVGLLAVRTNYAAPRWWLAAHRADDGLHERILGSLGLEPVTRLDITVTDGTAALAGLALLDTAAALLASVDELDAD